MAADDVAKPPGVPQSGEESLLRNNNAAPSASSDEPYESNDSRDKQEASAEERALRRKVDLRLCTIAGILTSLDLLDSNLISSASVTTLFDDIGLGLGNRFSVSIFAFTLSSIAFQLPATVLVRVLGPRMFFAVSTTAFGIITIGTAFVQTWRQMIACRVLLGISIAGIYPGLTYLISTWYTRREQHLRFAFLQSGEVFVLATGGILNYGLNELNGRGGLAGWRWMFLIQGILTTVLGVVTHWWMVDFPEHAANSFHFLTADEHTRAVSRIQTDRADVYAPPFSIREYLRHALDPKLYAFATLFFLLNLVSTALSYFLPQILQYGLHFPAESSILLSAPPYYFAIIPVLLSSYLRDRFSLPRASIIAFNALVVVLGISLLGFPSATSSAPGVTAARYTGTMLGTGGYISNWAALSAYQSANIRGQWKRALTAAVCAVFNGAGGVAGSFLFNQAEAPGYKTAVWTCVASQIGMCAVVAACTVGFWRANRKRSRWEGEGVAGWRYTY